MKAPYVIEHEAYLNDLERLVASSRGQTDPGGYSPERAVGIRGLLVVGVIIAIVAFVPWSVFSM